MGPATSTGANVLKESILFTPAMDTFELKDASPSISIPALPFICSVTVNVFPILRLWLIILVPVLPTEPTNALPSIIWSPVVVCVCESKPEIAL